MKLPQANYIIRLDDIHPQMDWGRFNRMKATLDRFNVKPIIAVVPDNQDPELMKDPANPEFWPMMQSLHKQGWTIAMHGYEHRYVTCDAGIMNLHPRSEFAGLPYEVQLEKIRKGKKIFEQHHLPTHVFIAPAHSFDELTCKALKEEGFTTISDGVSAFPFYREGLLWVPQIAWRPRAFWRGVITFCFHTDSYSDKRFLEIESFIKKYHEQIVSFDEVMQRPIKRGFSVFLWDIVVIVVFYLRKLRRFLRQIFKKPYNCKS